MLGNTNHFLITILVGLDAISHGTVSKSEEFSTSWNPRDEKISAIRSREFAIKALLAWTTDSVDAYMREITSNGFSYLKPSESSIIMSEDGLAPRIRSAQKCLSVDAPCFDLIGLAIPWRNRLVHSHSDSKVNSETVGRLRSNSELIHATYQGLNVDQILSSAQKGTASPTFKEVTAIVRAAHQVVELMDAHALANMDMNEYLLYVLRRQLDKNDASQAARIWGKTREKARRSIVQIAQNNGMSIGTDLSNCVNDDVLEKISRWTPKEARKELAI